MLKRAFALAVLALSCLGCQSPGDTNLHVINTGGETIFLVRTADDQPLSRPELTPDPDRVRAPWLEQWARELGVDMAEHRSLLQISGQHYVASEDKTYVGSTYFFLPKDPPRSVLLKPLRGPCKGGIIKLTPGFRHYVRVSEEAPPEVTSVARGSGRFS